MRITLIALAVLASAALPSGADDLTAPVPGQWPKENANAWYAELPWLVGCNYYPATAINQIDMWQASTFDPATIDRELALAASIGMNTLRVYLHDLVWADDESGLYARMDQFLILEYQKDGRPVIVTEWLARTRKSTVADCLPVMRRLNAGAIHWGFVSGEVVRPGEPFPEPELWFHDLFRPDHSPYDPAEIAVFKKLTGES